MLLLFLFLEARFRPFLQVQKEKELQRAREKLAALRKEKYKHAELDDSDRMF